MCWRLGTHVCDRRQRCARLARGGIDGQQHGSGRKSGGGAARTGDADMAAQLVGVVRQRRRRLYGDGRARTIEIYVDKAKGKAVIVHPFISF